MDPEFAADGTESEPTPSAENVGALLEGFRLRLQRMLSLRLDPRLRRRIDPADVLQEAFAEVVRRLEEYRSTRPMPFFLWVRLITGQKVAQLCQYHLGTARRDAGREVTPGWLNAVSTVSMARAMAPSPSPSEGVARAEILARVQGALERLEPIDREVLALRYFEQLSMEETAIVLGLTVSGATKRQLRALGHLKRELPRLEDLPTPP